MDFLKSYPFLTIEDYYWKYSHIMIQLMIRDATKVIYLSEKQAKQYKQYKRTSKSHNRVYTDSKEDLDAFEQELGI